TKSETDDFGPDFHSGPSSCLGPSCPTPTAHGHTSTPRALQSHPRPQKTPRSTDLGVVAEKQPLRGEPRESRMGRGLATESGSAEVKVLGWCGPIPSSVVGQDLSTPEADRHTLRRTGRLRLPRPTTRSSRWCAPPGPPGTPTGASLASLGGRPPP